MGLRDRIRGDDGPQNTKYQMREKLMSIGDDYWIEDDSGQRAFKVGNGGRPGRHQRNSRWRDARLPAQPHPRTCICLDVPCWAIDTGGLPQAARV